MKKHAGFTVAAALLAASCHAQGGALGSADDEKLIRSIPQAIVTGWNNASGRAVAAVYAENGTLVAGDGKVTRGRDEIARYHDEQFDTALKGTRLTVEVTNVRFLAPDVAIMHTEGGIIWPGQTAVAAGNLGVQSFVAIKNDGVWKVTLFQNTRIRQPTGG